MKREQLIHIFDDSACLTQRQMKEYVTGIMSNEEAHAVELHMNSCPLCNQATEGLQAHKREDVSGLLDALDHNFLQEHFSLTNPHIHLNSISHAHDERHVHRQKKRKSLPISTHIGIAASLLFALAIIWYFKNGNRLQNEPVIAAEVTSNTPRITHEDGAAQGNVTPAKDLQESQSKGAPDSRRPNNNGVVKPLIVAAEPPAGSEKAKLQETTVKDTRNPAEEPQKPMALASAVANMPAKTVKNGKTNPSNDVSTTLVSKRADEAAEKVAEPAYKVDKVEIGDDLYRQHKFDKALVAYRQAMKTENAEIRAEAAFKAAKCHLELGEQDKAILLLNDLASGDGPQQKQAKKLLRKIK